MQSQSRRRLIISGLVLLILLVGLALLLRGSPKKSSQTVGQHIDSFSHETVSSPSGKAPDRYGSTPNKPLYLGFDKLLDYGLTSDQLKNIEVAFYRYSQSQPKPLTQISVDVDHITTQHNPADPNSLFDILFRVQFDGKNILNAKAEYSGLNDIRLYLTNPATSALAYDSQVLYSPMQSD